MQDAMNDFHGSGEEVRIAIANADLILARGDVEGALATLRGIGPEQSYYVKAREKMAEIYLHHRKDRRLYASCYRLKRLSVAFFSEVHVEWKIFCSLTVYQLDLYFHYLPVSKEPSMEGCLSWDFLE